MTKFCIEYKSIKDGKCYYNAEMLDAFNYAQENIANFSEMLCNRVSNAQQI